MALFPVEDRTEEGSQDIYLLYESFNRAALHCITIVASIKPWCHEWRAYWMALPAWSTNPEDRFEECKAHGNKLDEGVARAMFPTVEIEYDVKWRA